MGKLMKNIYEHLKTYQKYRTLKNAYDTVLNDLHDMTNERDAQKSINATLKKHFDEELDKLLQENIELKKRKKKKVGK